MATGDPGPRVLLRRGLLIGVLLMNLLVIGVASFVLRYSYIQYQERAFVTVENLSLVLEQTLIGMFDKVDGVLLAVSGEVEREMRAGGFDAPALDTYLDHQAIHLPDALSVRVLDAEGKIRFASASPGKSPDSTAIDPNDFRQLREEPGADLVISGPIRERTGGGWLVVLARRLEHPDGTFAGIVSVPVPLHTLDRLFSSIKLGRHGVVLLFSKDQKVMVRHPDVGESGATAIGTIAMSAETRARIAEDRTVARYEGRSPRDGVNRAYFFRRIGDRSLYLSVAMASSDYLIAWWREVAWGGGLVLLFCLTSVTGAWMVGRRWEERNRVIRALALQEEKYRRLFHGADDIVFVYEADPATAVPGRIVEVNDATCLRLGYSREEMLQKNVEALSPDDQRPPDEYRRQLAEQGRAVFERLYTTRDGTVFPVEINAQVFHLHGRTLALSIGRDLSERKQAERALAESESFLRAIIDVVPLRIFWKDRNLRYLGCNPAFARDADKAHPDDIIGCDDFEVPWRSMAEAYQAIDREVITTGTPRLFYEERLVTRDGGEIWVSTSKVPLRDRDQRIVGVLGVYEDITARRASDARIQRLTNLYAALSQCNQAIVHCSDEEMLFPQICRCVVEYGFVKTAWIGVVDPVGEQVTPVVSYGDEAAWVVDIPCSTRDDDPIGRGPSGRAIRTGMPQWAQDFPTDASTAPWHEIGERAGWRSSAALPLFRNGVAIGCLTLYSATRGAFDAEARGLLIEMATDISFALDNFERERQRQRAARAMESSELRYRLAFQTTLDAVAINRLADGAFIDINNALLDLTGYTRDELIGSTSLAIKIWADPLDRQTLIQVLLRSGSCRNLEARFRAKSGYVSWGMMSASLFELDGVPCILSITKDITDIKRAEDEINHLAFHDPLTQLPNRRLLVDRLQHALAVTRRNRQNRALLFVDLDNFKMLNDSRGHQVGDLLLQEVARRLAACVRAGDTVARFGSDEFAVLVEELSDIPEDAAAEARTVGEKILAAIAQPYSFGATQCTSSASIGITLFGGQSLEADALITQADIAMHQAKARGHDRVRFFSQDLQEVVTARVTLEESLRQGLQHRQFLLYYQAQIEHGRVTAAEALIRWQHPIRDLVSPGDFIPLAEETGLILPLGDWVLETACAQIATWARDPRMADIMVAVNVSAHQFRQPDFVAKVMAVLKTTGADPTRLKLELTESMLVDNVEDVIAKMTELKSCGLRFSLDDFGTGYSSLAYLKRLPLDQLKIDRSFIRDVLVDANDVAIAQTIIALGQAMGMAVIAEGVETSEQRDFLSRLGCHAYQGYLFGRPVPAEAFERMVIEGMPT